MNTQPVILEAPMSYTGAGKRARLWTAGITRGWLRDTARYSLTAFWWLLVSVWYMCLIGCGFPLIWMYPYRTMRHRQRQERYIKAMAARVTLRECMAPTALPSQRSAMPKND